MVTINEARAQLEQQKGLVSQKKDEINLAEKQLREVQSKLPPATQQRLRQGIYSGLQGHERLKVVGRAQDELKKQLFTLQGYTGQISDYEKQLKAVEDQIANAEAEKNAFDVAKKLFNKNILPDQASGRVRYYLREFWSDYNSTNEVFNQQISDFQQANPSEKLIVDWDNMRVKGVDSGALGQNLSIDDYNKAVENFNKNLNQLPELKNVVSSSKSLNLNQKQDLSKVSVPNIQSLIPKLSTGFGTITAMSIADAPMSVVPEYIKQTGSPLQSVPLSTPQLRNVEALNLVKNEYGTFSPTDSKGNIIPMSYDISQLSLPERVKLGFKTGESYGDIITTSFPKIPSYVQTLKDASGITWLGQKRDENIKQKLTEAGLPTSDYYIQAYKREANPFTSSSTGLYNVAPFLRPSITLVDETGRQLPSIPNTYQEPGPNVPSLLVLGAGFSPSAITSRAILTEPQTQFLGTIERQGQFSKVKAFGKTTQQGAKPVYSVGEQIVFKTPLDDISAGVSRGYTFGVDKKFILPSTKPTITFKEITPFKSVSRIEELGKIKAVGTQGFRVTGDIGEGVSSSLVRSKIVSQPKGYPNAIVDKDLALMISRKVGETINQPFTIIAGGKPYMRINKATGEITYLLKGKPNFKGALFEVAEETSDPFKILAPANIKKTPLELTFQEKKAFESLGSTIKKQGEKAISKTKSLNSGGIIKNYGTATLLSGLSGGGNTGVSSPVWSGISDSIGSSAIFEKGRQKSFSQITGSATNDFGLTSAQETGTQTSPFFTGTIQEFEPQVKQRDFISTGLNLGSISVQDQRLNQKSLQVQDNVLVPRVREDVFSIQTPRVSQTPRQRMRERTIQRQRFDNPSQTGMSRPPRPPRKILVPLWFKKKKTEVKGKKERHGNFIPEIKRYGAWLPLGKYRNPEEALLRGKQRALATLGASVRVRKAGSDKLLPIKGDSKFFRPSKKNPLVIVQKRRTRLSSQSERREIQSTRIKSLFFKSNRR